MAASEYNVSVPHLNSLLQMDPYLKPFEKDFQRRFVQNYDRPIIINSLCTVKPMKMFANEESLDKVLTFLVPTERDTDIADAQEVIQKTHGSLTRFEVADTEDVVGR